MSKEFKPAPITCECGKTGIAVINCECNNEEII